MELGLRSLTWLMALGTLIATSKRTTEPTTFPQVIEAYPDGTSNHLEFRLKCTTLDGEVCSDIKVMSDVVENVGMETLPIISLNKEDPALFIIGPDTESLNDPYLTPTGLGGLYAFNAERIDLPTNSEDIWTHTLTWAGQDVMIALRVHSHPTNVDQGHTAHCKTVTNEVTSEWITLRNIIEVPGALIFQARTSSADAAFYDFSSIKLFDTADEPIPATLKRTQDSSEAYYFAYDPSRSVARVDFPSSTVTVDVCSGKLEALTQRIKFGEATP